VTEGFDVASGLEGASPCQTRQRQRRREGWFFQSTSVYPDFTGRIRGEVTIMKVHLKQVPAEGIHLEGKEETDILELEENKIKPLGPVEYSLDIGVSESGLFVTGEIGVDVGLECVSCLKRFIFPLRVEEFAAQIELTGPELVDLTPLIREDILLALPVHPHCDWDGKTKCVGPRLKYLNAEEDPKAPNAWDALDHLNLNRRK